MKGVEIDIDLNATGRTAGWLRLPWSHDRAGYGTVAVPIVVLANGTGPTLLLVAGNHGDEYEGQVALARLAREFDVGQLAGRMILLPAANLPAVMAGTRLSPLDHGNLNRLFGAGERSPTGLLASFIASELLPLAAAVIDLHSGGRSMTYVPSVFVQDAPTAALGSRTKMLVEAFGAPYCFVKPHDADERTLLGACGRAGVPYLSTELAGGERLDGALVELARLGIDRVLVMLGMQQAKPVAPAADPQWLAVPDMKAYVYAETDGVFQCSRALGEDVGDNDLLGWIHQPETPLTPPIEVRSRRGGILVCLRATARVQRGDCLGHVGGRIA
ncbi:MAG: succinylglutamate desuccinylase/aspartoacylase family protein [Parvibaculaceae bacterium]